MLLDWIRGLDWNWIGFSVIAPTLGPVVVIFLIYARKRWGQKKNIAKLTLGRLVEPRNLIYFAVTTLAYAFAVSFLHVDEGTSWHMIWSVMNTDENGLDLLPSEIDLAGVEVELIGQVGNQTLLRNKMQSGLPKQYDYVIVDTPPSLGLMTLNALAASTEAIIPVSASFFALKGLSQLEKTIDLVRERLDSPDLRITGILCTFYDRTNVARDVHDILQQRYGDQAFKTLIPKNVKVEEAHSRNRSVVDYAPRSKGARAYKQFVEEVISSG